MAARKLGVIFLLALAARLAVFGANLQQADPYFILPDSDSYLRTAQALRAQVGLGEGGASEGWVRDPGYPLLLAVLFSAGVASPEDPAGAILVQLLLSAGIAVMAAMIAARLGGRGAAWAAGLLVAIEPSALAYSNLIMSETLFTVALLGVVLAWGRWWETGKTGSLLAYSLLVGTLWWIRPTALYLPLFLLPLLYGMTPAGAHRGRAVTLFASVCAILIGLSLLAGASTLVKEDEFKGRNARGKAVFARHVEDWVGIPRPPASAGTQPWESNFARDQGLPDPTAREICNRYFVETIRRYPAEAVARCLTTAALFMGTPDARLALMIAPEGPGFDKGSVTGRLSWLLQLGPLGLLLALGMAVSLGGLLAIPLLLAAARRWQRPRRAQLALIVVLVLYQVAIHSFIAYSAERYRVPIIPLLAVTFSLGLGTLRQRD